jgi:hypothetical protein
MPEITTARSGRKHSPETKAKIAAARLGKKISPEVGAKISAANKGRHRTEATKKRMSESHRGRKRPAYIGQKISDSLKEYYSNPANRAKASLTQQNREPPTEETRRKISEAHKGKQISPEQRAKQSASMKNYWASHEHPLKGSHATEEQKERNRKAHIGKQCGEKNPMWGKHPSEETRKKLSAVHKGRILTDKQKKLISELAIERYKNPEERDKLAGENGSNWRGGRSFEPYCPKFNNARKDHVRAKFNHACVLCGKAEGQRKLDIHHIDYNKMQGCDGHEWALVPLCASCHIKTHRDRHTWFNKLINYYVCRQDINLNTLQFCDIFINCVEDVI